MSSFVKGGNGEKFGGGDYALPATTMYAYLEHALSLRYMTAWILPYKQPFALITNELAVVFAQLDR
jgi:hypothetical protein